MALPSLDQLRATLWVLPGWPVWLLAVFGTVVGSFLTTLIERLPRGESFLRGRSRCPQCGRALAAVDLVPVVSFLVLRGRCRSCQKPIPRWHLGVELATGLLFAAVGLLYAPATRADVILVLALVTLLIALAVIDLQTFLLPDVLVGAVAALALVRSFLTGRPELFTSVLGGIVGLGLFSLLALLPQRRHASGSLSTSHRRPASLRWIAERRHGFGQSTMGLGDVKFAGVLGLLLGVEQLLIALFLAFVSGGFVGAWLLLTKRARVGTAVPFGPFLSASVIALLLVPALGRAVFGLLGIR